MTLIEIKAEKSAKKKKNKPNLKFEKLMAILAVGNLIFVLFDLTYVPFRNFWLQGKLGLFNYSIKVLPINITPIYDVVKGIEANRYTAKYLEEVAKFEAEYNQLKQQNPQALPPENQLKVLRDLSLEMIDTDPFAVANKTGTLEKIKNDMRLHIFKSKDASAKDSFRQFWSQQYLVKNNPEKQLAFFNKKIKPLIETNYFRPIAENGQPIDYFWILDLFPSGLFFLEFLGRTWYIKSQKKGLSWFDAMLWRWYDIFLFLPLFQWLRIIPVTVRLSQSELLDLKAIQKQASQGFVATIAEDITEVILIRVVNQIQGSIKEGEITKFLSQTAKQPSYIDLNQTNETAEIIKLMAKLTINQVMPKIRTDIEALLKYNFDKLIQESPVYQQIKSLPGVDDFQNNLTGEITKQIYQIVHTTLTNLIAEDPNFDQLLEQLVGNFSNAITSEIQAKQSIDQLEILLVDLLEEVKINYISRLSQEDVEDILEQTRALRQKV